MKLPLDFAVIGIHAEGLSDVGSFNLPHETIKFYTKHHDDEFISFTTKKIVGNMPHKVVDLRLGIPAFNSVYSSIDSKVMYQPFTYNYPTVFFLSSIEDDDFIERQYQRVLQYFPFAIHVPSNLSIRDSHIELARLSVNRQFLVIDADCELDRAFDISKYSLYDIVVFHVRNPFSLSLEYGHGGPKLFNKYSVLRAADNGTELPDFTESVQKAGNAWTSLTVNSECVGTHRFNWSPYSTFRAAFRETAKLKVKPTKRYEEWIQILVMPDGAENLEWARLGIREGMKDDAIEIVNSEHDIQEIFGALS